MPTHEQLKEIERDLSFVPAPDAPQTLTPSQVQAYNSQGYLKPFRLFDAGEADDFRAYIDGLLTDLQAEGGDSYSLISAHMKHGRIWDLLHRDEILAPVRDLLGPDLVCWGAHCFCKMPRDGKRVAWHQDASYWPLTPSRTVSVWLAVDDVDTENACMRFIEGSHRRGHIPFRPSAATENNVLNQTVDGAEAFGPAVDVELGAGEFSMHSDLLLHGSEANDSPRRRCGLTLRYAAAGVRAEMGWDSEGVVVCGRDEQGLWADPPRPAVA